MKYILHVIISLAFIVLYGCIDLNEVMDLEGITNISNPTTFNLVGNVSSLNGKPLSGVRIEMISNKTYTTYTDENGYFEFYNLSQGTYLINLTKEGYRSKNISFPFTTSGTFTWNITLAKDCLYYDIEISRNYIVRYGYNGTLQKANLSCSLPYPENSYFNTSFSEVSKREYYIGSNRMLEVKIDNLKGKFSSIGFYFLLSLNGTNHMKIFEKRNTAIEEAAKLMPNYLGERRAKESSTGEVRKMIDPENEEIKEIALEAKEKAGNNTWDVAKELFLWLKNNTSYFNQEGVSEGEYVQSPSEMLYSRRGDCDELSYLYISLLRAAGIPSRFVEGYLAKDNETKYVKHMWVEFYDGEWVPVEVAGSGKPNNEYDVHFGIESNLHVPVYIDDGTQASFERTGCRYNYYGSKPVISSYTYYNSLPYNSTYLAVCGEKRYFTNEKE